MKLETRGSMSPHARTCHLAPVFLNRGNSLKQNRKLFKKTVSESSAKPTGRETVPGDDQEKSGPMGSALRKEGGGKGTSKTRRYATAAFSLIFPTLICVSIVKPDSLAASRPPESPLKQHHLSMDQTKASPGKWGGWTNIFRKIAF